MQFVLMFIPSTPVIVQSRWRKSKSFKFFIQNFSGLDSPRLSGWDIKEIFNLKILVKLNIVSETLYWVVARSWMSRTNGRWTGLFAGTSPRNPTPSQFPGIIINTHSDR
jgi:hypothetical protein